MWLEWFVGVRYLAATRNSFAPSVITVINVLGYALCVTVLIIVLSVMGGFAGDLRTKILGSKAHVLVTGPADSPLKNSERVVEIVAGLPDVRGVAPFIESDLLISSATNYSGIVLRGVEPQGLASATNMEAYMREGSIEWMLDPEQAAQMGRRAIDDRTRELQEEADRLSREATRLEREGSGLAERLREARLRYEESSGSRLSVDEAIVAMQGSGDGSGGAQAAAGIKPPQSEAEGSGAGGGNLKTQAIAPNPLLQTPSAPSARDANVGAAVAGSVPATLPTASSGAPLPARRRMPSTIGGSASDGSGAMPDAAVKPSADPEPPGILLGSELRDALNVEVGDLVQIVNPDGDLGPMGPIPRSWPYRVVGVFYTGLYDYDNSMVYMALSDARRFLNVPADEVTGVEIRLSNLNDAERARESIEAALASNQVSDVLVRDWTQLNERLFSALRLERSVMGLVLAVFVAVASIGTWSVLIMIVLQKGNEIAILRSMGASKRSIMGLFVVQGGMIASIGTAIGACIGLLLVAYLKIVGFPLDAEVYYIDRLPVELNPWEVISSVVGALTIGLLATIYPSVQAARLDPARALRHE